jgi:hypothetical protein
LPWKVLLIAEMCNAACARPDNPELAKVLGKPTKINHSWKRADELKPA